jgi:hypothetical protein
MLSINEKQQIRTSNLGPKTGRFRILGNPMCVCIVMNYENVSLFESTGDLKARGFVY